MRKKRAGTEPEKRERTYLTTSPSDAEARLKERIQLGRDLQERCLHHVDRPKVGWKKYEEWGAFNKELLKRLFSSDELESEYTESNPHKWMRMLDEGEVDGLDRLVDYLDEKLASLDSIKNRLSLFVSSELQTRNSSASIESNQPMSRTVFVVHGHDVGMKESVARFLGQLGLEATILHEKPNAGKTLIEKFESNAGVAFAVVLLSPDDSGYAADAPQELEGRSRQNVVFEFGYFVGRLGRDRVCAIYQEGVALPSDLNGLAYVPWDDAGAWKLLLAKEIKEAGIEIDLNQAM